MKSTDPKSIKRPKRRLKAFGKTWAHFVVGEATRMPIVFTDAKATDHPVNVEIRTVELTENMVRAIANQAIRTRPARQDPPSEAEFQASQTLVNAAEILDRIPAAMLLRYLQTLTEIGGEQNEKSGRAIGANDDDRVPITTDVPLAA